ncbi:MAG: type I restriction-modification system subunit M N-terminal domain-containing protein, partial [Microlunatus sp.]|nr:type I restriction-modification system subunit M N-terminal domain-containing protein [Microlunatus sp.]
MAPYVHTAELTDGDDDVSNVGNFVWSIADQLCGVHKPRQYGDVILPMTILRRLDPVIATCTSQSTTLIRAGGDFITANADGAAAGHGQRVFVAHSLIPGQLPKLPANWCGGPVLTRKPARLWLPSRWRGRPTWRCAEVDSRFGRNNSVTCGCGRVRRRRIWHVRRLGH